MIYEDRVKECIGVLLNMEKVGFKQYNIANMLYALTQ